MSTRNDPLDGLFGAGAAAAPAKAKPKPRRRPPAARAAEPSPAAMVPESPAPRTTDTGDGGAWSWPSGIDTPKTHRYPLELVDELDNRTKRLDLPVGLTVAAALASFLDLPDDELISAVERAQSARRPRLRRR